MSDPRKTARPKTFNEALLDRTIRHGIYLTRLAGGEANWAAEQMEPLRGKIMKDISPLITQIESKGVISEADRRLIEQAADQAEKVTRRHIEQVMPKLNERLAGIAVSEAQFEKKLFEKQMPIGWNFSTPPDDLVREVVANQPVSGKRMDEWFSGLAQDTRIKVNNELEEGILNGESVDDMVRRVRGRRANKFRDGVLQTNTRNAQSLVRSGVMSTSNRARGQFHQANEDVIRGYSVVVTLDSRTCSICVNRESGNPYPIERKPDPPFHVACRCLVTAITKSWEELGIDLDEAPPGTRASMNGEVPDTMNYEEWFDDLGNTPDGVAMQHDILGTARFKAYQNGVKVTAFADNGKIMSLDQLRATYPGSFVGGGVQYKTIIQKKPAHFSRNNFAEFRESTHEYLDTLSEAERDDILDYKGVGYRVLNPDLRRGDALTEVQKGRVRALDKFLENGPKFNGTVYRGVSFSKRSEFDDFINKTNNAYFVDNAYVSTTLKKSVSENFSSDYPFKAMIRIKAKNGVFLGPRKEIFDQEFEILLKRGTRFKVKKHVRKRNQLTLDLVEVSPGTRASMKGGVRGNVQTSIAAHKKAMGAYSKTLSADHRAALRRYTSEDEWATQMNKAIREGGALDPKQLRDRDLLMDVFNGAPRYQGEVHRGIGFDDTGWALYNKFLSKRVGDTITDTAFGSSSVDQAVATNFAQLMGPESRVIMNIKGKRGIDISSFSSRKSEAEILFKRGSKFKVVGRRTDEITVRRGSQFVRVPRLFLDLEEM